MDKERRSQSRVSWAMTDSSSRAEQKEDCLLLYDRLNKGTYNGKGRHLRGRGLQDSFRRSRSDTLPEIQHLK
jgi:hypothetical protein